MELTARVGNLPQVYYANESSQMIEGLIHQIEETAEMAKYWRTAIIAKTVEECQIIVYGEPEDFNAIQEALKEKGITEFSVAEMQMIPQNEVTLTGDDLEKFEKMIDVLDELEDVQQVYHNVELDD